MSANDLVSGYTAYATPGDLMAGASEVSTEERLTFTIVTVPSTTPMTISVPSRHPHYELTC